MCGNEGPAARTLVGVPKGGAYQSCCHDLVILNLVLQGGPRGRAHCGWLEQSQGGQRRHHLCPATGVPSSNSESFTGVPADCQVPTRRIRS